MMLTAVGRASLRRLIAPSILPCVTPLLVCKVPSSSATLLKSAAAAIQTRPLSTTRCLAFPAATKKTTTKSKAKKKKPAPKKKVSKKKPAKKKLVAKKKTISPEKKAAAEKKGLKEQALLKGSPDKLPDTPWVLFVQSKLKGSKGMEETQQRMKDASVEFRRLSDTKLQVSSFLQPYKGPSREIWHELRYGGCVYFSTNVCQNDRSCKKLPTATSSPTMRATRPGLNPTRRRLSSWPTALAPVYRESTRCPCARSPMSVFPSVR